MATRQQRGLGTLSLHDVGYVDKRILVLVVIIQNRIDTVAHGRGHGSIRALMAKNAQARTGDAGNRQGLVVTPRTRVNVGTTALSKIGRAIAGGAQHTAYREADDDQAHDGKA